MKKPEIVWLGHEANVGQSSAALRVVDSNSIQNNYLYDLQRRNGFITTINIIVVLQYLVFKSRVRIK